ncbi:MAG: hypothetical protein FWG10_03030 [Eubacteriaceae bacterium]|nr:hypothetical protein [Eubacteriaceae bacterium]
MIKKIALFLTLIILLSSCGGGSNNASITDPAKNGGEEENGKIEEDVVDYEDNGKEIFTYDDIEPLIDAYKDYTIGQLDELIMPTSYSYIFIGEETNETELTLISNDGDLSVMFVSEEGDLFGDGRDEIDTIPSSVKSLKGKIVGVVWKNENYPIKTPRGLGIGTSKDDVIDAFLKYIGHPQSHVLYDIRAINKDARDSWTKSFVGAFFSGDEIYYVWTNITQKEEQRDYCELNYWLDENQKVESLFFHAFSDPPIKVE